MSPGSVALRVGQAESEKPALGSFWGKPLHPGPPSYGLDLSSDPSSRWGRPLLLSPLLRNPT